MVTPEELRFAHVVVKKGWLPQPRVDEALRELECRRTKDPYFSLYSYLVSEELLAPERIEEALRLVRSGAADAAPPAARPASCPPPMPRREPILQDEDEEGGQEQTIGGLFQGIVMRLRAMPFWGTSALLHVVLLVVFMNLVWSHEAPVAEDDTPFFVVTPLPPRTPPVIPPFIPPALEEHAYMPGEIIDDTKSPVNIREYEEITPDIPKGTSLEALTNVQVTDDPAFLSGLNDPIGIGAGAAAAYGIPDGRGHDRGLTVAHPQTQTSVEAALQWLQRHQSPDGRWSCHDYQLTCDPTLGTCTNHPDNPDLAGAGGRGWKDHDIGVTALAVLAFTGAGHTHQTGMNPAYKECLRKASAFLKSVQIRTTGDPAYDGCFRMRESIPADKSKDAEIDEDQQWMYDHAIATLAMAELLILSEDQLGLRRCVEEAAQFCLRAQNAGWGWRYGVKMGDNDTSVTGWMVLALKAVTACREVEYIAAPSPEELAQAFKGALNWFDHVTSNATGFAGYKSPGDEGSRLPELDRIAGGYPFEKGQSCMTAVTILCRLFAHQSQSSDVIKKGIVNALSKYPPKWQRREGKVRSTINFYYWYYASQAMFQYGGGLWNEWNKHLITALVDTQRRTGADGKIPCAHGSWDPIDEWSLAGGRVYTTAMGALTLEVYYRFKRVSEATKL